MNKRQYKKLCKKSAEIIGFDKCDNDGGFGIWHAYKDIDWCGESDSEPTWDYLVARFSGDVNTVVDKSSVFGISWKPDNELTKATPAKVFAWARKQEWK